MQRRDVLIGGFAALAACGTRLNPFTWFRRRAPRVKAEAVPEVVDPRGLMARLTEVRLEETSTGAILRATGLASAQGGSDAELVGLATDEKGVKTFEFRLAEPEAGAPVGPAASRTITAAVALSVFQLGQISALRVLAAENAMTVRP